MTPSTLLVLVAALAALYSLTLLMLVAFQRRLIFLPFHFGRVPSVAATLEPFHFPLETDDGEILDALWMANAAPDAVPLLYLHGTAATLRYRAHRIQLLHDLGFSVLAIDWRGYGRSTGEASQEGLMRDAKAAITWLGAQADIEETVILGESLGASLAIELAATHKIRALALESPFYSMLHLLRARLPLVPVARLLRDPFRSDLKIGKVNAPLLIQHGRFDPVTPIAHGRRLYEIAQQPKRFIAYPWGLHHDLVERCGSYRDLKAFVDSSAQMRNAVPAPTV